MTPRVFCVALYLLLLANTAYISAYASPTIAYMGNVLLHLLAGILLVPCVLFFLQDRPLIVPKVLLLVSACAGIYLAVRGNTYDSRWVLVGHIVVSIFFVGFFSTWLWRQFPLRWFRQVVVAAAALLLIWPAATAMQRRLYPNPDDRIRNSGAVPLSMDEEGEGPKSPFWPSAARTDVGGTIPSNFFMDSELCGECHQDIYQQWKGSVHHFASFNNQFYRKSIENMQDISGTKGSKWCAGCHDHAVFFNGRFDRPIKEQVDTPEAQNGLGCVSCHSIVAVDSTMGNGGFTISYPPLHDLASSRNPYIRIMDRFLTYLDPEPHRKTFMKPFMRLDSSEYCSTCHKVHLDVPVNNYRWVRGFNDYDNWQASGVSGQGARSFYYPPKSSTCSDCHMPAVASKDAGNREGKVHSHRFAAANTAVAHVNKDAEQLSETEKFLRSGFITVDIFSASPVEEQGIGTTMVRRGDGPQLASTFAVGEEADSHPEAFIREVGRVAAPLDRSKTVYKPGSTVKVDVVVRTRKIGHFFPGGTVDAFDVWLELEGSDANGAPVFWSGKVDDNGKGPVESGAHFYRSFQLNEKGEQITKRNAFQTRSVLYVRLIPPGAADVAHFRVKIPPGAKGPISLKARLNYRKFAHVYTQFAYEGTKAPPPDLPIVTLATSEAKLPLGTSGEPWAPQVRKQDRERWNDWGIGLLLQGDLKGAEYAFLKVTECDPTYADGWLNVARALIQEGETDRAKPFISKALGLDSSLARIHFFRAMIQKADGDYDGALASLRTVESKYPRDRVALNQAGRIQFLKKDFTASVQTLQKVLVVDPEDVQAHYTLMLAHRGLGDSVKAAREEKLFRRFKADESSQSITAQRRALSREDNNERQSIHDHESIPLPGVFR